MKKWITHGKNTVHQVLNGRSNAFLISRGSKHVLVDTGRTSSWKKLNQKLDILTAGNGLEAIVLTHTHFDHVENAAALKEKYHGKIIVQRSEAEYLMRGNTPLPQGTNFLTKFIVTSVEMFKGGGRSLESRYKYRSVDPDIEVDETFCLNDFGIDAHVIHTPGHSYGSLSVVVDDELALVGDTVFGVFGGYVFPPFADDIPVLIESWDKLLKTGSKIFIPGHGGDRSRKELQNAYDIHKNLKKGSG
ncbi:Hydroxyacylglutathione hydrolase [anaerobic digester metagenome]